MKKLFFLLLSLIIFLVGCSVNIQGKENSEENIYKTSLGEDIIEVVEDEIQFIISNMSLDEKIGQLVIAGIENLEITDRERELIQTYKIGGFVLFKRNIIDYEQTLGLLNSLKKINTNKIPLFLSIDEEGGRVSRLDNIFINLPPVSNLGIKNNEKLAFDYGNLQASKLLALGFNLNFSPVLDVNSNTENKIIGDRAISENPEKVALLGRQIFKSMMESGIVPVGKHYPGHGDTLLDSHYNLPLITKSLDELEEVEFIPFKYAIKNDIPGLMIGHLYLENLSQMPASLSFEVITDLLRNEHGFKGLVFSDDLTMGAISETYDIGTATVKFLKAGGDVALICHGEDNIFRVINYIKEAIAKKQITEAELDEKLYRIISIKDEFKLNNNPTEPIDVEKLNNKINKYVERGEEL